MRFCTVVARNYLAYARVLGQSLRDVGDDLHLSVLVLDDVNREVDDTAEPFDVLRPSDLDISPGQFHHMAVIYDLLELATAVKPWLLHRVLADDEVACYLDPDIQVFGSMDPVEALAKRHSIVLTPHSTTPLPRDGLIPSEQTIRLAGVFNLGFIAVSRDAGSFLSWWSERSWKKDIVHPSGSTSLDGRSEFERDRSRILHTRGCWAAGTSLPG